MNESGVGKTTRMTVYLEGSIERIIAELEEMEVWRECSGLELFPIDDLHPGKIKEVTDIGEKHGKRFSCALVVEEPTDTFLAEIWVLFVKYEQLSDEDEVYWFRNCSRCSTLWN
jgi:hypothetical protein